MILRGLHPHAGGHLLSSLRQDNDSISLQTQESTLRFYKTFDSSFKQVSPFLHLLSFRLYA